MSVFEGGVHFPLINSAIRASFTWTKRKRPARGFHRHHHKTQYVLQQVLTVLFCSQSPSPIYNIRIMKQGITTAQDVHFFGADRFYWRRSWRKDSSCQIQERRNSTASLIYPCSIWTLILLGGISAHKLIPLMMLFLYALPRVSVTMMIINLQRVFWF